jgi:hypothetical protein
MSGFLTISAPHPAVFGGRLHAGVGSIGRDEVVIGVTKCAFGGPSVLANVFFPVLFSCFCQNIHRHFGYHFAERTQELLRYPALFTPKSANRTDQVRCIESEYQGAFRSVWHWVTEYPLRFWKTRLLRYSQEPFCTGTAEAPATSLPAFPGAQRDGATPKRMRQ